MPPMTRICPGCRTILDARRVECPNDGMRTVEDWRQRTVAERYVLTEPLSVGPFQSTLWSARTESGRGVTIALFDGASPDLARRLGRVASTAKRVVSPHLARVVDHGQLPDGMAFIAMQPLTGRTMHREMSLGPMSPRSVADYGIQTLEALHALHALGIVHGGVDAHSIFLSTRGTGKRAAKLLNAGLCAEPTSTRSADIEALKETLIQAASRLGGDGARRVSRWLAPALSQRFSDARSMQRALVEARDEMAANRPVTGPLGYARR